MRLEILAMLKVKKFTIKEKKVNFTDVKFMDSQEKSKVYKKWISFLNNHFSSKQFTKNLYSHLYTHCGYIAHYNLHGFYGNYFMKGSIFNKMALNVETPLSEYSGINPYATKYLGKEDIKSKYAYYDIIDELLHGSSNGDNGIAAFLSNWNKDFLGVDYRGDYGDLNSVMKDALDEYVSIWVTMIEAAESKLTKVEEETQIKELKAQKAKVKKTIEDANRQLELLDIEIIEEAEGIVEKQDDDAINNEMNLFDFFDVA